MEGGEEVSGVRQGGGGAPRDPVGEVDGADLPGERRIHPRVADGEPGGDVLRNSLGAEETGAREFGGPAKAGGDRGGD